MPLNLDKKSVNLTRMNVERIVLDLIEVQQTHDVEHDFRAHISFVTCRALSVEGVCAKNIHWVLSLSKINK